MPAVRGFALFAALIAYLSLRAVCAAPLPGAPERHKETTMYGPIEMLTRNARPLAFAAGVLASTLLAGPASARGPENIADVAEKVIDAVVNISTSQTVTSRGDGGAMPNLPPGSPFEEFF